MTITGANAQPGFFQLLDNDGNPLPNGKLYTWLAGTSTPQAIFTDQALTTEHPNPAVADANGVIHGYFGAFNHKIEVRDSSDANVRGPYDGVRDIAQIYFGSLGQRFGTGTLAVGSNYTVLTTDQFVELTTSGLTVTLHAAASNRLPLTIKNMAAGTQTISPQSGETIDGLASYTIPAAATPLFPAVVLLPNEAGTGWFIQSSHGIS